MDIEERYNHIPDTSSLSIRTSGLLGEQYLALNVGFEDPELGTTILKDGSVIQDTKSDDAPAQSEDHTNVEPTPGATN